MQNWRSFACGTWFIPGITLIALSTQVETFSRVAAMMEYCVCFSVPIFKSMVAVKVKMYVETPAHDVGYAGP